MPNAASDESISVPKLFSNNDILRLKTLGLLSGDDETVRLTARGREVIKTLVLNEENQFGSRRAHKPYTEILAEMQRGKGRRPVRLAQGG